MRNGGVYRLVIISTSSGWLVPWNTADEADGQPSMPECNLPEKILIPFPVNMFVVAVVSAVVHEMNKDTRRRMWVREEEVGQ